MVDSSFDWRVAIGFGILAFLSEQFTVTLPNGSSYSVTFVVTIATILVAGPAEACLATACALTSWQDRHRPIYRHAFNMSQLALTAGAAGLVYVAARGPIGTTAGLFPRVLLPLALCTATNFLINTSLVSGAIALSERRRMPEVWRAQFAGIGPAYVAFALLGLLLAVLYLQMSWAAVLFLLMPLLVARRAFQAAITMQEAYDRTVQSLIHAIEAKDPYTRGHAERVSRLSVLVARAHGLSEEKCRVIRYAALMHDIGKLGVLSAILQKPGKLTPEEYEHMKQHPLRGVEIVEEIDLLKSALVAVRHHHEMFDGRGYPDGLAGEAIPLFARLITVADAFDSMTSTRSYRKAMPIENALGELHRCSGTQFDPAAIASLERAIARWGWEPAPEDADPQQPLPVKRITTLEEKTTNARLAGL